MNDLSGLDWSSSTAKSNPQPNERRQQQNTTGVSSFASISRQSTPVSAANSGRSTPAFAPPAASKKADSFADLLGTTNRSQNGTSLQEKQRLLLAEKARLAEEQRRRANEQFKVNDASFWEGLGAPTSGRATPSNVTNLKAKSTDSAEDDLFAAFNASAPVDSSSHFPPPPSSSQRSSAFTSRDASISRTASPAVHMPPKTQDFPPDDDDPFGLNQFESKRPPPPPPQHTDVEDEDDILGDLAKPAGAVAPKRSAPEQSRDGGSGSFQASEQDKAVAELVDMGFPLERAEIALAATDTGFNVQAAVGILLNQAHEESRSKSKPKTPIQDNDTNRSRPQTRTESKQPASNGDKDVGQYASELGSAFFKSANSLWKTGQKRVQKAVADFQQPEGNDSTPRWMKEASARAAQEEHEAAGRATAEAMMLDSEQSRPRQKPAPAPVQKSREGPPARSKEPIGREWDDDVRASRSARPAAPRERVNRQAVEDQSAQAYVSPARRRKAQPNPAPAPAPALAQEMDIFADDQPLPSRPKTTPARVVAPVATKTSLPAKAKPSSRVIPSLSPAVLASSTAQRTKGSEAFKRGDYAEAQSCYTNALSGIPDQHPIAIVIRCNRALTNSKTGDPKAAVIDADIVLNVVGPSRGEDESIDLGNGEAPKPMKEFFGKALMRKAEALEHMEKWTDAGRVWKEAVEAGVGGSIAIQGRTRCEKAASPRPPESVQPPRRAAPRKPAVRQNPVVSGGDSAAVKRLREANAAATAASDEQFALSDSVTARLDAWKAGKADNLRGLLASLDTVLWEGSGWNKVGMADLVMPNRVKIIYMKAIAKVHPDKLSQTATTEQKMISAAVFATLNEAWDKFKKDNNL